MTNPAPVDGSDNSVPQVEKDRAMINEARTRGTGPLFWAFTKLSGPGWLQSAITLGGGSLGGSLYLGVLAGYSLMWLQPLAMALGIIMLSAIGYVALSTGEKPFRSINQHVSPVLGWGWILATVMANFVWCMPQYTLGTAAIQQNLMPHVLGKEAIDAKISDAGTTDAKEVEAITNREKLSNNLYCATFLFVSASIVVLFYGSGGWGIRLFEVLLKCLVGVVVLSFFGVVIKMSLEGLLDWGTILSGFVPDVKMLSQPSPGFESMLAATGEFREFWTNRIVSNQQQVMITAAATAVGINMTFLLPYSMLQRGWDHDFRGLAIFDLSTGLLIPFMLATGCVVIASASQFHAKPESGLVELYRPTEDAPAPAPNLVGGFNGILDQRLAQGEHADEVKTLLKELSAESTNDERKAEINKRLDELRAELPTADLQMAAALVNRDAFNLANSLEGLVGATTAQKVFGIGVLGMAISTIIILMLINGFAICEIFGVEPKGWTFRFGALAAGLVGSLGPFFWSKAAVWLVVPTSMFGMVLLPIAYWTFFFMMNSRSLLGEDIPKGLARIRWNVLMLIAAGLATFGSLYSIYASKYPTIGFIALGGFVVAAVMGTLMKKASPAE
ncbi:Natural resistance-associated macrophage protein [Thalassoglobus neptunius]|uniref:Natural resistance-associated macrophage protein n=1 Tax=Thalassoglobus neptunius TaxID=1938619 RepID=A0A5C5VY08_9PLAN|nr:divalent metal cation transporter [Thalassoglobus neptunius]TWT42813.1 Natural resistance-associated macrophage protein [Thalassoglobus neptunius]